MKKPFFITASLFASLLISAAIAAQPQSLDAQPLQPQSLQQSSTPLKAGNSQLFDLQSSKNTQALSADKLVAAMAQDESVLSIDAIQVNTKLLSGATKAFYINLGPGRVYPVALSKNYWLNRDYQAWTGAVNLGSAARQNTEHDNRAVFVRSGARVFGQLNIDDQIFEIMTTEAGRHILVERDFSQLGTEDDTPELELPVAVTPFDSLGVDIAPMAATSTIRVLQVTSTTAINRFGVSAIVDRMNFFIAQSNDVYANNDLSIVLQDAGKYNSGRSELSSVTANTFAIKDPNDGYLDQFAGSLRNSTGADIVAHITDNTGDGLCGRVNAIGGGQSNGFFVTRHVCTNFTFVHEIGHLFGARHDNDPTTTPFAYGHGFVSTAGNFRTVMAVSSNPQPRIGFFSTDDQNFNGFSLGNASFRDNERVHAVRAGTVANFR